MIATTPTHLASDRRRRDDAPLILTVRGLGGSGPGHWQSEWESAPGPDAARVDLGDWNDPRRNTWVNRLNLAIRRAGRPVVLVAHSLGCHAVAWWVEYEASQEPHNVIGALLVAPPEVDGAEVDPRLARFAPAPERAFPFPTIVAASRDDPWISFARAKALAKGWGALFADAGPVGHINAESRLGAWPFGRALLGQILRRAQEFTVPPQAPALRPAGLVAAPA